MPLRDSLFPRELVTRTVGVPVETAPVHNNAADGTVQMFSLPVAGTWFAVSWIRRVVRYSLGQRCRGIGRGATSNISTQQTWQLVVFLFRIVCGDLVTVGNVPHVSVPGWPNFSCPNSRIFVIVYSCGLGSSDVSAPATQMKMHRCRPCVDEGGVDADMLPTSC